MVRNWFERSQHSQKKREVSPGGRHVSQWARLICLGACLCFCTCSQTDATSDMDGIAMLGLSAGGGSTPTAGTPAGGAPQPPVPPPVGGPALPGEPNNPPELSAPQIQTFNHVDDGRAVLRVQPPGFLQPVHGQTAITVFLGLRTMALQEDGTVTDSLASQTRTAGTNSAPIILNMPSDRRLKVLVVARNEFGTSVQDVNVQHARTCVGAVALPGSIGDCDEFCIRGSQTGNTFEYRATRIVEANEAYLVELDIEGTTPIPFGQEELAPFAMISHFGPNDGDDPLNADEYGVGSVQNGPPGDFLCVRVRATRNEFRVDDAFGFEVLLGYFAAP